MSEEEWNKERKINWNEPEGSGRNHIWGPISRVSHITR
jgi:hypothetical protein